MGNQSIKQRQLTSGQLLDVCGCLIVASRLSCSAHLLLQFPDLARNANHAELAMQLLFANPLPL